MTWMLWTIYSRILIGRKQIAMKKYIESILILFLLLAVSAPVQSFAQGSKKKAKEEVLDIRAQVTDNEGKPIAGAMVYSAEGSVVNYTDENGYFRIKASAGEPLLVEAWGYVDVPVKAARLCPETIKMNVEELFASHGCGNNLAIVQPGRTFARLTNYSDGQPVTREKHEKCGWERSKINIRNGKIYNCPSAEFADLFTGYFGSGPRLTDKDFLVIDENLTREAIERFRGPTPMCAHCDISRRRETFPNAPSERKREEWSETKTK